MITEGARVRVTDPADSFCGRFGTVTVGEHPAVLTQRPMVEVKVDAADDIFPVGYYTEQVEELELRVVA